MGASLPAWATQGFAYRWKSPRVTVNWREGNSGPETPALRREVGHWKRLAETLWSGDATAAPLQMDVSLYGPEMGSQGPAIKLKSGPRTAEVKPPITEEGVFQALVRVRGGTGPTVAPPDDAEPRISADGQWVAAISWRGAGPEVWITKRDLDTVTRVPFVGGKELMDRLVLTAPEWSVDGRQVAWIQGGRVLIFDTRQRAARYVTAADRRAVEFLWPPREGGPLLVRYDDEKFDFLDAVSGSTIPVSDLLKGAASMGRFFWSPTGQRLLFRTQSRIEVAALTVPGRAATMWDRFLNKALGGPPEPPQPREGENTERLAVLDLRARRLDAFPLEGTPLDMGEISSVSWSPDEQTVFAVTGETEGEKSLVRFPLEHGGKAQTVLTSDERLVALGWRSSQMTTDKLPDPRFAQYALLKGDEVLTSPDGLKYTSPYSPDSVLKLEIPAGPHGGYRGVEDEEELTESEPPQVVYLESMDHAGQEELRRRFPGGMLLTFTLDQPVIAPLKSLVTRDAVDLDIIWHKGQTLAVGMLSPGGGVGQLVGVAPHPVMRGQTIEIPFTEKLTGVSSVVAENPVDQPFPVTDVATGTSTLSLRYARFDPVRLALYAVLVLAVLLGLFYLVRKKLAR